MVRVLLVLLSLYTLPCMALERVESHSDMTRMYQQQSVLLTITADDKLDVSALDIRPLFKNFIVGELKFAELSRNGRFFSQWQIPLLPLQAGQQQIPKLTVSGLYSQAITLQVLEGAPPETIPQVVDVSLDRLELWPGQVALYRLKISQPAGIQIDSVTPPTQAAARIQQIGDDLIGNEIVGGKRSRTLIRTYAILLNQPGRYLLQSPVVQGQLLRASGNRPFLQQGPQLSVQIEPLPHQQPPTLISDNFTLEAHWQTANSSHKVGDPLLRLITIKAIGNTLDQLPAIELPAFSGVRSYADGQSQSEGLQHGKLVAERTIRQAFIPQQPGKLTFPPITIRWWNSLSQRLETAELTMPPVTIEASVTSPTMTQLSQTSGDSGFPWLTLTFAIAWLATLLTWWFTGRRLPKLPKIRYINDKLSWRQLKRALRSQDPQQIHLALLHWGCQRWPHLQPTCLEALPCYPDLRPELDALLAACFAQTPTSWSVVALRRGLLNWREEHPHAEKRLNPEGLI